MELSQALGLAYFLGDKTADMYRNKLGVNFVDLNGNSRFPCLFQRYLLSISKDSFSFNMPIPITRYG